VVFAPSVSPLLVVSASYENAMAVLPAPAAARSGLPDMPPNTAQLNDFLIRTRLRGR